MRRFFGRIWRVVVRPRNTDTDRYGTFSGEIPRESDLRNVLRAKALEGAEILGLSLGLASEGMLWAHPYLPFVGCDHEALLFIDRERRIEIFSSVISTENQATMLRFVRRASFTLF